MPYILRVVIHEDQWERQLQDIIWICKTAGINEIFLKEQCHQILMSPFPLEKHKRMAKIYKRIFDKLKTEHIRCGINIASIIGHVDCKLAENKILPFEKFTGASLKPCDSVYCILDPKWQKYAAQVVALYAETGPDKIMIDDDFRSLNHSEPIGCFCKLHTDKISKRLGKEISAKQLRETIIKNSNIGKKVRKTWLDINFEGQLAAARKIEKSIHSIDSKIQVGLMNSGELAHALQGRDMKLLLEAFSGEQGSLLSRPIGGSYRDCLHEDLIDMHQGMALSISCLPASTQIISEVENWPHTLYTKSLKITNLQMKLHCLAGAHKNSLNIFDFLASPYKQEMSIVNLLKESKNELKKIQKLREGKELRGLGLLWYPGQIEKKILNTERIEDLPIERNFDTLLPLLGIPTCFKETNVNLLSSENASCCDHDTIVRLLKKGLILDARAAQVLCEKGYDSLIGCSYSGKRLNEISAELFTDKKINSRFTNNLLPTDWMRLYYRGISIPLFEYSANCKIVSVYVNEDKKYLGNGIALFENQLGGKVCIIPSYIGTWQFAYRSRAHQMVNIIKWLSNNSFPVLLKNSMNMAPFYYESNTTGDGILALLNTGLDTETVTIEGKIKIKDFNNKKPANIFKPLELKIFKTKRDINA